MPLSPLGILHTIVGGATVLSAFYLLWHYKQINISSPAGKIYLIGTVITAASALGIFKHGSANVAHLLAALTLAAVIAGTIAATTNFLGWFKKYAVALCFSATILFHLLPTATEILTRFPAGAPRVTSLEDPLLLNVFASILVVFLHHAGTANELVAQATIGSIIPPRLRGRT